MKENYVYPAKMIQAEGNVQIVFSDFPNILIEGENYEEALSMAQEALALTIMDYENSNTMLPVAAINEKDVIYIHVWMPYFRNIAKEVYVRKSVTIPQWLDNLAKNKDINFSAALVRGLKEELGLEK